MEKFVERMYEEKAGLDEKTIKLMDFVKSDSFEKLNKTRQQLLKAQLGAMEAYSEILLLRIELEK